MFSIFKKPKIEFYPVIPELLETFPPDNGKKDIANIFKNIKPSKLNPELSYTSEVNLKNCPAIIEYFKYGYVVRLWQDIHIHASEDGEYYAWKTATNTEKYASEYLKQSAYFNNEISHFPKEMYSPYFYKDNTLKYILQIPTRWCIKLPKNYGALFLPVWYDNEDRFTVVPGLLPAGTDQQINVAIQWNKLGTEEVLKAGTPIVKIIPFKMEKNNVTIRQITGQDASLFKKFSLLKNNHF